MTNLLQLSFMSFKKILHFFAQFADWAKKWFLCSALNALTDALGMKLISP